MQMPGSRLIMLAAAVVLFASVIVFGRLVYFSTGMAPFAVSLDGAASSYVPALRHRLSQIVPQIQSLREVGGTVGVSVGVSSFGHTVLDHHFGFADADRRVVANSSTRYMLGSLSKAFVAATVAQFVDEGHLSWEDEGVASYVPELAFVDRPELAKQLSLVDILSHRTGLARLDALWLGADGEVLIDKNNTVTVCNHLPLIRPVRSRWLYNNWMYALAGEIIERVSRRPWGHVVAERVLKPLGLSQTSAIASEIPGDSTALPYVVLDDHSAVRSGRTGFASDSAMAPAGGIHSTVGDLLVWGEALLSQLRENTEDDKSPLSSLAMLFSGHSFINSTLASDELYGLGFGKVVTPAQFGKIGFNPGLVGAMPVIGVGAEPQIVFYHNGAITGYNHCLMLVPQLRAVIVVLTNSIAQGDVADWIAQTLLQVVLNDTQPVDLKSYAVQAAAKWRGSYQTIENELQDGRRPDSEEPQQEELVGKYWHTTRALYLVVFQEPGGVLKFNINGRRAQEHTLSHYANDTFAFLPSAEERLRRGLFHYAASAWKLEFKKDTEGHYGEILWNLDSQAPAPEKFVKNDSE
ncbi:Beta-lactamase/transpeptidase-like protein [Niveomyces insectorum RCEF 264]|uniref:Beta-lactamase/transpeptidase-like protein n=1 Tax=Niveomyces insectorum RCEF 264 TaxID=1081102 RepID=A0A167M500_9HYPO|nr:Beta-lactamase/transpeptidase-like protein [Niveomyces insectorum RCEF 264]